MPHLLFLAAAGLLAGTMNAIAGGGSFVTFPAMVLAGLPPVIANASSTVALFPGTVASTCAYRHGFTGIGGLNLRAMLPVTALGGLCGALLLLHTPARAFDLVIPWLLLLATITFAAGDRIGMLLRRFVSIGPITLLVAQFVISLYGGYFGGAVGLMMLAAWSLLTASIELKAMAPARTLLISTANGAAVLLFIASGVVRWPDTLALLCGAVIGGYGGAHLGRALSPRLVRVCIIVLTAVITALFFRRVL